MKIARRLVAAIDNLAQPVADARVARRAVDIEAFLPTRENFHGYREGHLITLFAITVRALNDSRIEVAVFVLLTASNRIQHLRPRTAMIGKHFRSALRNH